MKVGNYTSETFGRYLELKCKRSELSEEGLPILERLRDRKGISSQEAARGKEIIRGLDKLEAEIREVERQAGGPPEETNPIKLDPEGDAHQFNGNPVNRTVMPNGRSYRDLFHSGDKYASLDQGIFENFEEFLRVLSSGRHDPRLAEVSIRSDAMSEGIPSEGGFLVPEEFGAFLWDASLEREIVRPRAQVWSMKTQTRKVPAFDGFDHTSNVYGGFAGVWLSEGGTATRQKAKLRQIQLTAKKLGIYTQASRELIEDGVSYEAQISEALTLSIAFYLDYAFFQGTGAGQPLGLLNDPALVTTSKETGQPADTFLYQNCTKMMARLHPTAFGNAIWIANQTLLPQFMEMSIAVGTGGSWIKAVEQRGTDFYLIGKRLLFTEKLPVAGTKGDVLLVDLSKYVIGMRQEVILDKSNAPGWTEDLQDYRTILRCDGQGSWSKAVTPKNGDSLSWCVALEART